MNWEAIGAIGEIVGALAVVITLAYLVIQIRQNTAAVATATYESTMTGFNDINVVVASNPELASLLDRGTQSPDTLSAEEITQFNFLLRCYANQWWKLLKLREGVCRRANGPCSPGKPRSFWISRGACLSASKTRCLQIYMWSWRNTKARLSRTSDLPVGRSRTDR